MTQNPQTYPIGIQTFSDIRERKLTYIDKTDYVWHMTREGLKYVFLSRPRRFGKSLLVSTLQAYFEGRKELFEGLAIEKLETEWTTYPVLHFDMSMVKSRDTESLTQNLLWQLKKYEDFYQISSEDSNPGTRLATLIRTASQQTGRKVVVLIDEYDTPQLQVLNDPDRLEEIRFIMHRFFAPLKACDPWLRYVFLTGITRFTQISDYSGLNNITDISMFSDYAGICGFTEQEISTCLRPGVEALAAANNMTTDEALQQLKATYDGYHFTWPSPDLYNPYCLLRALSEQAFDSYWFKSGNTTFIIDMMRRYGFTPSEIGTEFTAAEEDFYTSTEFATYEVPILYQSGYLTICAYDRRFRVYTIHIPNKEVRLGLMSSLIKYYVPAGPWDENEYVLQNLGALIQQGDIDGALHLLQQFLLTIPYTANATSEGHFQQVLYVIFSLLGYYVDVEVHTPKGRVDMILRTPARLYVIELKMNRDAATAMTQIEEKNYVSRFALAGLPVTKVAVNFDSQQRTISDWQIK